MLERLASVIYFIACGLAIIVAAAPSYMPGPACPECSYAPIWIIAGLIWGAGWGIRYILSGKTTLI